MVRGRPVAEKDRIKEAPQRLTRSLRSNGKVYTQKISLLFLTMAMPMSFRRLLATVNGDIHKDDADGCDGTDEHEIMSQIHNLYLLMLPAFTKNHANTASSTVAIVPQ